MWVTDSIYANIAQLIVVAQLTRRNFLSALGTMPLQPPGEKAQSRRLSRKSKKRSVRRRRNLDHSLVSGQVEPGRNQVLGSAHLVQIPGWMVGDLKRGGE